MMAKLKGGGDEMTQQARALFISHGGGPMPLLGDPGHSELVTTLKAISSRMAKPDAIVVISAHWEESVPTITAAGHPSLIYDYYGFPEESYGIQYPCVGYPSLAGDIHRMLYGAGLEPKLDPDRGFDHGLFVPLKIMYPDADIPCVQLSLVDSLDPGIHLAMGRALQGLNDRNVLVLGSGFSFHNMKAFFARETDEDRHLNKAFEAWLADTCNNRDHGEAQRAERLLHWSEAEGGRYCHPREEHLLPLHVCYGMQEMAATDYYSLSILNKASSMYLW